jgi:hypothetical protein
MRSTRLGVGREGEGLRPRVVATVAGNDPDVASMYDLGSWMRARSMTRNRSLPSLASAICLVAACSPDDARVVDLDPRLLVTDSAGIEIVSFDAGRLPRTASVDADPAWVLGDGSDAAVGLELHRVGTVTRLTDGRIAIPEGSTGQIIVVDLEGRRIDRIGGRGDGPSEFNSLSVVFAREGGGVAAYDSRRNRVADFDADGAFVGGRSLPTTPAPGATPRLAVDARGTFYLTVVPAFPMSGEEEVERPEGAVVRVGERADTLAVVRGREVFRNAAGTGAVIFGATTETAAGEAGIWIGDTAEPRIEHWVDPDGPDRMVRWESAGPREVTEADLSTFFSSMDAATAEESGPPPSSLMRDLVPFAERKPAYGRLLVSAEGHLWVGPFVDPAVELFGEGPSPPEDWMVVRFDAGVAEWVTLPGGFRITEVKEDRLLGVQVDDLGVETVREYRFRFGVDP